MNKYKEIEKMLLKQGKFYISLELDRIKSVMRLLGNPQDNIKIIHVAGTNGKGSVCSILNQILVDNGYKTGLFTSPHLLKYNERIKVNGVDISDDRFYELTNLICNISEKNSIHLTEFEILTAVMYKYFYDEKVDYAVVEVGLGGRYDATNCIKNPIASVITSVSYDHTERLGDTIEKIAFEKAGIIKENCPVIFNKDNLGYKVLKEVAKNKKANILYPKNCEVDYKNGKNFLIYDDNEYDFSLYGKHQAQNAALAICAVKDVLKIKNIENSLNKVKWACRFQYIEDKNILLDGCHNPDGAKVLRNALDLYFPEKRKVFVYTSLKNKDYLAVQEMLFKNTEKVYHYDMNDSRFISKDDVKNVVESVIVIWCGMW